MVRGTAGWLFPNRSRSRFPVPRSTSVIPGLIGKGVCSDSQSLELVLVPDDGAVEELWADRSDPAFSERVGHGGADGGLEDLEAIGLGDLAEVSMN